jgi:hypothetical protein
MFETTNQMRYKWVIELDIWSNNLIFGDFWVRLKMVYPKQNHTYALVTGNILIEQLIKR